MISTITLSKIIMPRTMFFACKEGTWMSFGIFIGVGAFGSVCFGCWAFVVAIISSITCQIFWALKTQQNPHCWAIMFKKKRRSISYVPQDENILRYEP